MSSLSFVSLENMEWAGLRGPEVVLLGESFKGDNDRFRSTNQSQVSRRVQYQLVVPVALSAVP